MISANIHRRHLTAKQKRDLLAKLIKATTEKSNRQIAETAKVNHKTVASVRAEMEATGEIPQLTKTVGKDGKTRHQPARKTTTKTPAKTKPAARDDIRATSAGEIAQLQACINKLQNQNRRQQTRIAVLKAKIEEAHAARRRLESENAELLSQVLMLQGELSVAEAAALKRAGPDKTPTADDGLDIPTSLRSAMIPRRRLPRLLIEHTITSNAPPFDQPWPPALLDGWVLVRAIGEGKTLWRRVSLAVEESTNTSNGNDNWEHRTSAAAAPVRDLSLRQAHGDRYMAFGKRKSGGGEIMPILKFDARAGTLFTQDRVHRGGSWQTEQHDVTDGFRAVFDLANAQIGWILFPKGAAPEMVLFPAGADIGEAPSSDHKEGVRLLAKLDGEDVVRELLSTALALWNGMDALHDAYFTMVNDHNGEVPVVELADVKLVKNAIGNISYEPVFEIVDWTPRPPGMPATPAPRPQPQPQPNAKPKRGDMDDEVPF